MKFEFKMMRPTDIYGNDYDNADCITYECHHETISDIKVAFDDFLRGCGFFILDDDDETSDDSFEQFEHEDEFDGPRDKCPHCHPELNDDDEEPFTL